MTSMEQSLASCDGLDSDKCVRVDRIDRILFFDKKGCDSQQFSGASAICTSNITNHSTELASSSFQHISVGNVVCFDRDIKLKPTVVVQGVRQHESWPDFFPGANFCTSPKGSFTCTIFIAALEHIHQQLPQRLQDVQKWMACDSGGGTYMHISRPETTQWCLWRKWTLFILDKNCTKAMCVLDQELHRWMAKMFTEFRQTAGAMISLNKHVALFLIGKISDAAQDSKKLRDQSWESCGWTPGCRLGQDKLLAERAG